MEGPPIGVRLGLEHHVIDRHTHVIATFPGQHGRGAVIGPGLEVFVLRIPAVSESQVA